MGRQDFFSEAAGVLGSCTPGGKTRINAFPINKPPFTTFVIAQHEDLHRTIFTESCLGQLQILLFHILQEGSVPRSHQVIYNNMLCKSLESSFLVHEGLATYVSLATVLFEFPEQANTYRINIPSEYTKALEIVETILPQIVSIKGNMEKYCTFVACARLLGGWLCSQPILPYYKNWHHIKESPLKYIDYDSSDEFLIRLSKIQGRVKKTIEYFREFSEKNITTLLNNHDMNGPNNQQLLQQQWCYERKHFNMMMNNYKVEGIYFDSEKVHMQISELLDHWQCELASQNLSYLKKWKSTLQTKEPSTAHLETIVNLGYNPILKITRNISDVNNAITFIKKSSIVSDLIIAVVDKSSNSYEIQIEPSGLTSENLLLYVISIPESLNSQTEMLPDSLDCTVVHLPIHIINLVCKSISRPGIFWCCWAKPYIQRQILGSLGSFPFPVLTLPYIFLKANNINELISNISTSLEPLEDTCFCCSIGTDIRICLVRLVDEYIYTPSDHGIGESYFIQQMRLQGCKKWIDNDELGRYGKPQFLYSLTILADGILSSIEENKH